MKLAQGERVLDDPRLLRKAVKKESKEKAKKAKAWQARNQTVAIKQRAQQSKCVAVLLKCAFIIQSTSGVSSSDLVSL
jgi:hypothetical protein